MATNCRTGRVRCVPNLAEKRRPELSKATETVTETAGECAETAGERATEMAGERATETAGERATGTACELTTARADDGEMEQNDDDASAAAAAERATETATETAGELANACADDEEMEENDDDEIAAAPDASPFSLADAVADATNIANEADALYDLSSEDQNIVRHLYAMSASLLTASDSDGARSQEQLEMLAWFAGPKAPLYTGHMLSLLHNTGYGATTQNGDTKEYKQTGAWATNTSKKCYVEHHKQFSKASHYHNAIEYANLLWNGSKVLSRRFWRTGDRTCVLDALNFAVGYRLVSIKIANAISQDPLQFNALANAKVKTALANAGVLLLRVETSCTIGMAQIMGQTEGTFLVCYKGKGEAEGEEIRHCVTIDCLRRIAFCNENGVYPFCLSADPGAQETTTKHQKLKKQLGVGKITLVYRVLFKVGKWGAAGETRVLRECTKAPQPDNKRQKQK